MEQNQFYFDHAAAVPVTPETFRRLNVLFGAYYANQEAMGAASLLAADAEKDAMRRIVSVLTGSAESMRVLPGHSGTEVIAGLFRMIASVYSGGTVLYSESDHSAVRAAAGHLPDRFRTKAIPLRKDGTVDPEAFAGLLTSETVLVSIPFVTSETGAVNDCSIFRRILLEHHSRAMLFCDGIQGVGKVVFDWNGARPDFFTVSGQKLGLPAGAALLYRDDWHKTAQKLRMELHGISRLPVPCLILLADVLEERIGSLPEHYARMREMQERFLSLLEKELPDRFLRTVPRENVSPYITHLLLKHGIRGAIIVRSLATRGVSIASGSACDAETPEPSRVLRGMGYDRETAYGALRLSFFEEVPEETLVILAVMLREALDSY